MKTVILCGGSGTRLWPISRTLLPKQFVKIFNQQSLFQKTLERNSSSTRFSIVINQDQYFMGYDQLEEKNLLSQAEFILEPVGRNTAPAIALAAFHSSPEEILLVVPSDHLIQDTASYEKAVKRAHELAVEGKLVTFGIRPTYAETGFGYLETQGEKVLSFKEKPAKDIAEEYVKKGNYYWNSGMFCFKASVFLNELKKYAPDIYEASLTAYEQAKKSEIVRVGLDEMKAIRSDSIDYAVMEKSQLVAHVATDMGWSDLGSFDALYENLDKDAQGNTQSDLAIHIGSKNNLIVSSDRLISTIDVENLMIVDTKDALLIAQKGSTQKVKDLVGLVKKKNDDLTQIHTTAHRPWGTYTILDEREGYKVKRITVRPKAKLSLQYHHHRSEHWTVVSGEAEVTINDKVFRLKENESTYIPKEATHRLFNPIDKELILIEAQVGSYLGEDDIVRLQDDYQRK